MDALKKAEEEKRQAAKRLEQADINSRSQNEDRGADQEDEPVEDARNIENKKITRTVELSLEPLDSQFGDTTIHDATPPKVEEVSEREVPTEDANDSEDLTLENPIDAAEDNVEKNKDIDLNDTTIIEGLSTEYAAAPFDDTFHGVLIEEEEENTDFYEETLPGVPADQLVKDLGSENYQATPVAAQTVFTVGGKTASNKNVFTWTVLSVLILIAIGSFAVFYYFTITPVARKLPSPAVARGIESSGEPVVPVISPIKEPDTVTGVIIKPEEAKETVASIPEDMTAKATAVEVDKPTTENETAEAITTQEEKRTADETLISDVNNKQDNDIAVEKNVDSNVVSLNEKNNVVTDIAKSLDETEEGMAVLPQNKLQSSLSSIRINKKAGYKKENVMVKEAFKAYQSGHYEAALSLYQDVVKNEPDNRDAHLGLAAIAIKNKNYSEAYKHYLHILHLNPEDALAHNALINLAQKTDPVNDESAIKTLLQKEGDVPYLYFSLGNLYAKQHRWPEAQQAFFEAYRLDTTNADYVLNLAISLDHIGQYASAYDYYKTALAMADTSSASFDYLSVNALTNKLNLKP